MTYGVLPAWTDAKDGVPLGGTGRPPTGREPIRYKQSFVATDLDANVRNVTPAIFVSSLADLTIFVENGANALTDFQILAGLAIDVNGDLSGNTVDLVTTAFVRSSCASIEVLGATTNAVVVVDTIVAPYIQIKATKGTAGPCTVTLMGTYL
jgi:hypothetical protein